MGINSIKSSWSNFGIKILISTPGRLIQKGGSTDPLPGGLFCDFLLPNILFRRLEKVKPQLDLCRKRREMLIYIIIHCNLLHSCALGTSFSKRTDICTNPQPNYSCLIVMIPIQACSNRSPFEHVWTQGPFLDRNPVLRHHLPSLSFFLRLLVGPRLWDCTRFFDRVGMGCCTKTNTNLSN